MALIVEDGSGLSTAESYVSVAECDTYFAALGNETWADVENKEAALRKATQYIDSQYRFRGDKGSIAQALSWPRFSVEYDGYAFPANEIPKRLKSATCELALKSASADLLADVSAQYAEEVKVGPIVKKMSGLNNGGQKRFALVDSLLSEFVSSGSGSASIRIVRA